GGAGGLIEVSGQGTVHYDGSADAGAPQGANGTLLLDPKNIIISAAPVGVFPQYELIDPHPTTGGGFGTSVTILNNGNVLVTNPHDDFGSLDAGAIYLFDGSTGALLSSLIGGEPGDRVGDNGITLLNSDNYLIVNPAWNDGRGAATWGS